MNFRDNRGVEISKHAENDKDIRYVFLDTRGGVKSDGHEYIGSRREEVDKLDLL